MASRRGVLFIVVALTVLGTVALVLALRLRERGDAVAGRSILVWDVPAQLDEAPPSGSSFSLASFQAFRPTVLEATRGIRRAARDNRVEALVLHLGDLDWGWAKVAEVRAALVAFGEAGKPVYASIEGGGENSYLLAIAAHVVSMPPTRVLQLNGLAASALFLRGSYDKLDIHPNFDHIGTYKSAAETYTRTDMSDPARRALESLLDDTFGILVDTVSSARHIEADSVRALIDRGPFEAEDALAAGLLDTLMAATDAESLAVREAGVKSSIKDFDDYVERHDSSEWGAAVAVVYAEGEIISGRTSRSPFGGSVVGSETLIAHLREARERRSIRAVVLRIDSPGGDADASEAIWREVERLRLAKPVVVSMSDLAASGGYYIAVAGDSILAEPGTITGSIGILGGKLNLLGLYRKLGMNVETVSRGAHAEMMSPFRDFSPEEQTIFHAHLESFYRTFLERVARGRGMTTTDVDSVGQGRVWSGLAARSRGLIDDWGGLEDAIGVAARRAGLSGTGATVAVFPRRRHTWMDRWASSLIDENDESAILAQLPGDWQAWARRSRLPSSGVQARMPYDIVWH